MVLKSKFRAGSTLAAAGGVPRFTWRDYERGARLLIRVNRAALSSEPSADRIGTVGT
jgi:hypothetical protein